MQTRIVLSAVLAASVLAGCVSMPTGPRSRVMPAPYKPLDVFATEDRSCRQYAYQAIGGETPKDAAVTSGVTSAAVGTAVGAGIGALAGGHRGAGVGAAVGLGIGALGGASAAGQSSWELQRRYDLAYEQCMYASGNQVPGMRAPAAAAPPPPPPGARAAEPRQQTYRY